MRNDGDHWAVVALDLPRCSLRLRDEGNDFNPVVVCLLPFDGAIDKAGRRIGAHRNFSGDGLTIRACFPATETVEKLNSWRFGSVGSRSPGEMDSITAE